MIDVGDGIELVDLEHAHDGAMFALIDRNREHLGQYMGWVDDVREVQDTTDTRARGREDREAGKVIHLALLIDGELLGTVGARVDKRNEVAEVGYWIDAGVQGRGVATRAVRAFVHHLFSERGMHRVQAWTVAHNERSQRVLERLGFQREGVQREADLLRGERSDRVLFGLLRSEWTG